MKKNVRSGFVLAETIAISTVVIIALVIIYTQFVTVNNSYYKSFTYNNVNKLYLVNQVKEFIISDSSNTVYGNLTSDNPYIDITNCENYFIETLQCKNLMTAIDAKQVLVTTMDTSKILQLEGFKNRTIISENMYSYIKNSKSTEYGYRIIIEFNDGNIAGLTTIAEKPVESYYVADIVTLTSGTDTTSTWRVIEDSDYTSDTVKLLKATNIDDKTYVFDEANNRTTEDNPYCTSPDFGCNAYEANGNTVNQDSSIKNEVDTYGTRLGIDLKEIRLIKTSELLKLGCEQLYEITGNDFGGCLSSQYNDFLSTSNYWIINESETRPDYAWALSEGEYKTTDPNYAYYGIRPVIIVSKDVVKKGD